MKWVGLTGGLGTGKTTVSQMLLRAGIPVIDADRISREVTEAKGPAFPGIVQAFGPGILQVNGELDRSALAKIIFSDSVRRLELEQLVHPFVQQEVLQQKQWVKEQGHAWAVYDVPLLFEKKLQDQFDHVVVVNIVDPKLQIERIKTRNAWNDEEIQKRLNSQVPLAKKVSQAHTVISNDADLQELEKKVAGLVQMLNDLWQEP